MPQLHILTVVLTGSIMAVAGMTMHMQSCQWRTLTCGGYPRY